MESDEILMRRFQQGDESAFVRLIERYQQKIFNFFIKNLSDYDLSEDLTQDVFLRVYKYGKSFNPRQKFRPWLYKIARNLLIKAIKSYHSDRRLKEELLYEHQLYFNPDYEVVEAVRNALNQLPEVQKEVVILKQYQGLTFAEIAVVLNCPESTVKSRMYQALRKLKKILKEFRR
ncbi:MAG TPA: RNA polymerase sigma factor [candidate division WOR-3 bacterium]|uniref:RNA polymerase sigma factor n=1 Tax=candidate division WOR-3 bacterium TaxID=2052148 RepID=A0A9C9JZW7_UNCW3|nr:RNA polymerase sigma factor [candidate division WOR-3 bacterium]